ncbi:MAG TPA: hypothetical protein VFZ91_08500 [Allosphingosinicella sp.]
MFPASLRNLVLIVGMVAVAAAAQKPPAKPRTPQAALALDFLRRLESGDAAGARTLLAAPVARLYPPDRLASLARGGHAAAGRIRQIRSEGPVSPNQAYANQLARSGRRAGGRPSYIVCLAELPRTSHGAVTYVAVVLVATSTGTAWQVSDFRYQSEPDRNC